ncbi:SMC-Scp complex subunit ScpB [Candidatus Uhrbacteria bacterium CG_4_9_14_3_um_filter_36_7]|uniref:SMC-Scp complex subunit ScpB n=1 Tax=Candidatus Uhrbacteria bacterium CG_4_9_14_3_um_filter_36_7 TaxID=1975033 RepID=A0A2M7XIE1_9BACT|nr:MAG: SMC-Scp complex subunit ScpB [Candidatus Uhrbacteria bacterium CG_4_9_14_3_um_filter_36_7]
MSLKRTIEALLFTAGKPISLAHLQKIIKVDKSLLEAALGELKQTWHNDTCGIQLLEHEGKFQFVSHPQEAEWVKCFIKDEFRGELTRPSLETLTIIAYRGPITKSEIEQIRGVNCGLILRHLLLRGLVEEQEDKERLQSVYTVSMDFLRYLGIQDMKDLPEYKTFHDHQELDSFLSQDKSL